MENDITLIKEAGFNCVRFAAATIHPYYLQLCQVHGLFAFIELPISGVPSGIAEDQSFISRGKDFLFNYISFYGDYPSLAAIGLGESYLPDMEAHISLISSLAAIC